MDDEPAANTPFDVEDQEIRTKRLSDPEVRARVREIKERLERGDPPGPGVDAEDLQRFLREHA